MSELPPRRYPFRSVDELELPGLLSEEYVNGVVDGLKIFGDLLVQNRDAIRHDDEAEPLAVVLELLAGVIGDLEALEPVEVEA